MAHILPDGRACVTHSYALPGVTQPPKVIYEEVPFWNTVWEQGEIFKFSDVDELPDELWREKKYCKETTGIKAMLFIPLQVGGVVYGLISFVSVIAGVQEVSKIS